MVSEYCKLGLYYCLKSVNWPLYKDSRSWWAYLHDDRACIDKHNLIKSFSFVEELYVKYGFNKKAKYGMLRNVATENACLAKLLQFKGPRSFELSKEAISKYVRNCKLFASNFSCEESCPAKSYTDIEKTCNDVREVKNCIESKLDGLAEKFQNLTLKLRKHQTETQGAQKTSCLYCQEAWHY